MKHFLCLPLLLAFSGKTYGQTTLTYSYTGSMQSFTVPACVTSITVDARGSKGGDNTANNPNDPGGLGGQVTCVYPVSPGQVLNIFVGGIPYNGGGSVLGTIGAQGGGASDIRIGGIALADRVIVAGGGGGGGNNCGGTAEPGGMGGGLIGGSGWQCGQQTGANGKGGTQTAGGGTTTNPTNPGTPGVFGIGGNAGSTSGGGGGGGYYGGGGAAYGGGGGGSSYTDPSATSVVHTQGFQNTTGFISIAYMPSLPVLTVASTSLCAGNSITLTGGTTPATTYTWSNGANTTSISVSPTVSTNYTVTANNSCGTSSAVATVSVSNLPSISLPSSTVMCGSNPVTLNATGSSVNSYSWNTGAVTSSISVSPTVTTNYTVTGTGACGIATATTTVLIGTTPTVSAVSSESTICANNSAVLTASGSTGSTFSWNTGASSASISVSPSVTTVYTVTADNGCGTATASVSLNVVTCTGVNELSGSENILLYPNPADDFLHIVIPNELLSFVTSIEIRDALGRLVLKETQSGDITKIDLSHMEHGIYFIQISAKDKLIRSEKIVKL